MLDMGRFWGRLGDPLGASFGKKPLLGAENFEAFSVSGSMGGPGPLFGRFWDDFSVDLGVILGSFREIYLEIVRLWGKLVSQFAAWLAG